MKIGCWYHDNCGLSTKVAPNNKLFEWSLLNGNCPTSHFKAKMKAHTTSYLKHWEINQGGVLNVFSNATWDSEMFESEEYKDQYNKAVVCGLQDEATYKIKLYIVLSAHIFDCTIVSNLDDPESYTAPWSNCCGSQLVQNPCLIRMGQTSISLFSRHINQTQQLGFQAIMDVCCH
jgi:hypothetical protein